MSSRILRGNAAAADVLAWKRLSNFDQDTGAALGWPAWPEGRGRDGQAPPEALTRELESRLALASKEAYEKGVEDGEARSRQAGAAHWEAALESLARSSAEIAALRRKTIHDSEEDVVRLALAVARRVLYRELTVSPDALLGVVKAAIGRMDAREIHRIRVRPQDAAMIRQHLQRAGLPDRIEVSADPALETGAAVFELARGALDASVDTQLEEIGRGLADLIGRAS